MMDAKSLIPLAVDVSILSEAPNSLLSLPISPRPHGKPDIVVGWAR